MIGVTNWDFFIAHAGAESAIAEALHDLLKNSCRVFLDTRDLRPGENWPLALRAAHRGSRITLVLASTKTDKAFYEGAEIAAAIQMARQEGSSHRVIPIYLDGRENVPYGLEVFHSLSLSGTNDLPRIAQELLAVLRDLSPELKLVWHPASNDDDRGDLSPCTFSLNPKYKSDPYDRWKKLADVLVKFRNPLHTRYVFLVPSGAAPEEYHYTDWWLKHPELLDEKRAATQSFVKEHLGLELSGAWFPMKRNSRNYTTVYCSTYDKVLESMRNSAAAAASEST
jgi:hypothetical protein